MFYRQFGNLVEVCCTAVLNWPVCWSCLEILNLFSTTASLSSAICSYLPIARLCTSKTFEEAMEHPVVSICMHLIGVQW